jgi:hypothetical protein
MAGPPRIPGATGTVAKQAPRGPTGHALDPRAPDLPTQQLHDLALDLVQLAFDLAGLVDPTPVSDGASLLISLGRGQWLDAAISGVSLIPYVGDLAKAGKLPKYLRTVEKAIELAEQSKAAAKALLPGMEKLYKVLELLPDGANKHLDRIRAAVRSFVARHGGVARAADELPDISSHFRFDSFEEGDKVVKVATGRLGVPGKVKNHRKADASKAKREQASVASGSGDHAGHMLGVQFGAPNGGPNRYGVGMDNLSLQNARMNAGGTWQQLEQTWAENLKRGYGYEITVTDWIKKGQTRPYKRKVTGTEILPDGTRRPFNAEGEMGEVIYPNFHTPASRAKQNVPPTKTDGTPAKVIEHPAAKKKPAEPEGEP